MRVWVVNHYAVPPTEAGGTRHHMLGRRLVQRGHKVTIIASSIDKYVRGEVHLRAGQPWSREVIDGVSFVWLRTPPYQNNSPARIWNMAVFAIRLLVYARRTFDRPDIVIGSSPHLLAAWAAAQIARRYRVPFVLEVRDLWPQTIVDFSFWSARHPAIGVLELIERNLYQRADRIILVLPEATSYLIRKGAWNEKIIWLPNGVDFELVPPPIPPREGPVFSVVYAGAHGVANCLDSLLDAAVILQAEGGSESVQFRLIGDGPEKPRLQRRVEEEGLQNVIFDPPVPKNQVYLLLQEADAFVLPARDSPLYRWGMSFQKLFDYMASARPVIFGAKVSHDPISEAQAGITARPEDPQAIASAVKQLVQTPRDERWEMGLRGRRYVEQHHDWSHLANKVESLLLDVVQCRHELQVAKVLSRT